jgi:putative ABC transport system substrate-binding protein
MSASRAAVSRRAFLLAGLAAAMPLPTWAQAQGRRLGILAMGAREVETPLWSEMLGHLGGLGYKEGSNLAVAWRFASDSTEKLQQLARELAGSRLHAVATMGTPATRALQRATTTIPIVTGGVTDPVLGGFAQTVARPGRNVTGLSLGGTEVATLQIGLLKSMLPNLARLALVRGSGDWTDHEIVAPIAAAAKAQGITVAPVRARDGASLDAALRDLRAGDRTSAAFIYHADQITPLQVAELALRNKVPTMFEERGWVAAGGLMAYSMHHRDPMKQLAQILVNILRGAPAADSPFELPVSSYFVINVRTAASLGVPVPPQLLVRADETIG